MASLLLPSFSSHQLISHGTWNHKFDLVHIRHLLGSFSNAEWNALYPRCYENIVPGGWIEQVELDVNFVAVDDSMPQDSILNWKDMFIKLGEASGRPFDVRSRMEQRIRDAGFINVQTQGYKVPVGTWPKLQVYKDAGRVNKTQIAVGMEGWSMFLLTKFGMPTPWAPEEVQVWLAKIRQELNTGYRIYQVYTRVWGQKPADA